MNASAPGAVATLSISLRSDVPVVSIVFPSKTDAAALDSLELMLRAAFGGFEALLGHPYIVVLDTGPVSIVSMALASGLRARFVKMYDDIYDDIKRNVHSTVVVLGNAVIRTIFDLVMASKTETASNVTTCATATEAQDVASSIVSIVGPLRDSEATE